MLRPLFFLLRTWRIYGLAGLSTWRDSQMQFSQDQRDAIARMLQQRGIGCGRYFAPIHTQPAYADLPLRRALPVTESVSRRTLALPFFNRLDDERVERVTQVLRESIEAVSR